MKKLAFVVSHPIQYYAPLHRRLAARSDVQIKVFFTWHGGRQAQMDPGFKRTVAWDVPLTEGYDHETVPNCAGNPGTNHFFGLRNPSLVKTLLAWQPDAVHLTGYNGQSHLLAMRALARRGVPVLFRGDSHLLDGQSAWWRRQVKRTLLQAVYKWPAAFLCVGQANRDYYRDFGVPEAKLFMCPHSIDLGRFAEPEDALEREATAWRSELGIPEDARVLLFAGKFEDKKRPVLLMQAFLKCALPKTVLVMVGDGALGGQVRELAARYPQIFRVLPFQNQSRMPVVYRLGDWGVLPSAYRETWGLAVNEALACGRPVVVSDRVGCYPDVIKSGVSGEVFRQDDWADFAKKLAAIQSLGGPAHRAQIKTWARQWSIETTEATLMEVVNHLIV